MQFFKLNIVYSVQGFQMNPTNKWGLQYLTLLSLAVVFLSYPFQLLCQLHIPLPLQLQGILQVFHCREMHLTKVK